MSLFKNDFSEDEAKRGRLDAVKITKFVICAAFCAAFTAMAIYGLLNSVHLKYENAQAVLVVSQCLAMAAVSAAIFFAQYVFKTEVHISIMLCWLVAGFLAAFAGEGLSVYYKCKWWDWMLHGMSGVWLTLSALAVARPYLKKRGIESFWAALLFAVCFALAATVLWEIYEYLADLVCGTNMQKTVPEEFFNGGDTFAPLVGETGEIGEYFSEPAGYRFALNDTMTDVCMGLCGVAAFSVAALLINRFYPAAFDKLFIKRGGQKAKVKN